MPRKRYSVTVTITFESDNQQVAAAVVAMACGIVGASFATHAASPELAAAYKELRPKATIGDVAEVL